MNHSKAAARFAVTTGNWSSAIWAATAGGAAGSAAVPTAADVVTINNAVTVSITSAAVANSVTIGVTGAGTATLRFNTALNVSLTVSGDVNVNDGTFSVSNATGARIHTLTIGGNLTVGAGNTFNMISADATDVCNVTFNKNGSQVVSGTGTVSFSEITLNMGISTANILEVQSVITMTAGGLNLSNGTFKLSSASTIVPFIADITTTPYLIPNSAGLWNNGGTINSTASIDWTIDGVLHVSAGTINMGMALDNRIRTVSATLIIDGGILNIAGRITPTTNSYPLNFTMSGGTLNVPTVGSTSTSVAPFDMSNTGGSFTMSGGTIVIKKAGQGGGASSLFGFQCYASTYNVTGGTLQIGDATTPASQTIQIESTVPLYNLTVNSSNAKAQLNATPNMVFKHDVTLTAGQLDANGISFSVGNNWTNNSASTAFIPSTGTVTFNGAAAQSIGGTFATTFNNLTINNTTAALSSATVTLGNVINVNGALTLTRGYLVTTATNILNMIAGSTTSGTSASSYVNGPMTKTGTTAFIFPTGYGNGTKWARIEIGAPSSSSTFTAQYFAVPYSNTATMAASPAPALHDVSKLEYWQLDRTAGTGNATVTLYWEDAAWSGIDDCGTSDLRAAHWNGSGWENNNNVVTTTGACTGATAGTVRTVSAVTSFGTITFGSLTSMVNPLPIRLLDFSGKFIHEKIKLQWITATETNNDYFEVQRSQDGNNFESIAQVKGAGNSTMQLTYSIFDFHPFSGVNYYRLRQVDNDGKFSLSQVISVTNPDKNNFLQSLYPNPANEQLNFIFSSTETDQVKIEIMDETGKQVIIRDETVSESGPVISINTSELAPGIYFARVSDVNENFWVMKKVIIIRSE
ncbi:MAG: T9SS type A sorting domain-containing protein [Bacteroidetes bacterium]|nr:T9SS type A sorting domain-containing protein [Bacteroidota bacterium]